MTKEELVRILKKHAEDAKGGDKEMIHMNADDGLLEYIGDPEISKAFNKIKKWYA